MDSLEALLREAGEEQSELDKVLDKLFHPDNLKHITDLSAGDIAELSQLFAKAKRYKLPFLKQLLVENLTMRISKNRGGRKEFVKITSREIDRADDMERHRWMRDRRTE